MKIVASHQPHFNPYLGYLAKIRLADTFILSDDVQFIKGGFIHRNKIRSRQKPEGWRWLTIPVHYRSDSLIKDVKIVDHKSLIKMVNIVSHEYANAPNFKNALKFLKSFAHDIWWTPDLTMFNNVTSAYFCYSLKTSRRTLLASELTADYQRGDKNGRLIALTRAVGGDAYLAGAEAARTYLDPQRFTDAGIRLLGLEYTNPEYPQIHGGPFLPKMGVIDALMNVGMDAVNLIGDEYCQVVELN